MNTHHQHTYNLAWIRTINIPTIWHEHALLTYLQFGINTHQRTYNLAWTLIINILKIGMNTNRQHTYSLAWTLIIIIPTNWHEQKRSTYLQYGMNTHQHTYNLAWTRTLNIPTNWHEHERSTYLQYGMNTHHQHTYNFTWTLIINTPTIPVRNLLLQQLKELQLWKIAIISVKCGADISSTNH